MDARRFAPFLAALLFLALVIMAWLALVAGLGHGGRTSAVVHLKWILIFLGVVVVPISAVVFIRYHRIASPEQRQKALRRAAAGAVLLVIARGTITARMAGWPPILYAAWSGDAEMTGLLLAAGAEVYDRKNNDWPALVQAAIQGHVDVVKRLLERTLKAEAKNIALGFAAWRGHAAVVGHLLDAGADIYAKDRFGRNALQEACRDGKLEVIRLLLERSPHEVRVLDECGNALISAAYAEDLASLRLLLEKGVNVNHQGEFKWTALMAAAQKGSVATASFLLDKGADPNKKDTQGQTALQMAVEKGHEGIRALLLRRGARE